MRLARARRIHGLDVTNLLRRRDVAADAHGILHVAGLGLRHEPHHVAAGRRRRWWWWWWRRHPIGRRAPAGRLQRDRLVTQFIGFGDQLLLLDTIAREVRQH